MPGEILHVN